MKTGTCNASQAKRPVSRCAQAPAKLPERPPIVLRFDALFARPPGQPENLLEILRNRSN